MEQKRVQVEQFLDRAAAEAVLQRAVALYASHRAELVGTRRREA